MNDLRCPHCHVGRIWVSDLGAHCMVSGDQRGCGATWNEVGVVRTSPDSDYTPPTWVSVMAARIRRMNQLIEMDSGPAPIPCQIYDEDGRQCTLIAHDPQYAHRIEIEVEPDEQ